MRKSTALVAAFFALAATMAVAAAAPEFPPLTGRVVDAANILTAGTEAELTRQLEAHERATGQQIVVATVKDLGGPRHPGLWLSTRAPLGNWWQGARHRRCAGHCADATQSAHRCRLRARGRPDRRSLVEHHSDADPAGVSQRRYGRRRARRCERHHCGIGRTRRNAATARSGREESRYPSASSG